MSALRQSRVPEPPWERPVTAASDNGPPLDLDRTRCGSTRQGQPVIGHGSRSAYGYDGIGGCTLDTKSQGSCRLRTRIFRPCFVVLVRLVLCWLCHPRRAWLSGWSFTRKAVGQASENLRSFAFEVASYVAYSKLIASPPVVAQSRRCIGRPGRVATAPSRKRDLVKIGPNSFPGRVFAVSKLIYEHLAYLSYQPTGASSALRSLRNTQTWHLLSRR